MVRLPTWHTVLSCKGSPSSRTHFSFMFRLASSSRRSHLAELLIPIFSIRVRLKDGQARCSLPCFGGCGTLPVTGGLAPLPILIAQNVLVCCVTGIPFSMFSRRSGNLMVTASVHSFIDAVRNALIVVPFGWCTDPAAALPYNSVCGPFSQSSPCGASLPSRDHCCWRCHRFRGGIGLLYGSLALSRRMVSFHLHWDRGRTRIHTLCHHQIGLAERPGRARRLARS